MNGTRIDGSTPTRTQDTDPDCDETTLVCGRSNDGKQSVAASDVSGDGWYPPMLPEADPSKFAQLAKNMAAQPARSKPSPSVPSDAALRGEYEQMSDEALEGAVKSLATRLGRAPSSNTEVDVARFHAAEAVAQGRADAAQQTAPTGAHSAGDDPPGMRHLLPYFDVAADRGKSVTVLRANAEFTPTHVAVGVDVVHGHHEMQVHGVDVSVSGDAGNVGLDNGIHNADGSTGVHASGGATVVGGEVTLHEKGVGSVTLGASAGPSVELSAGLKKEGDVTYACIRAGLDVVVGVCFPVEKDAD